MTINGVLDVGNTYNAASLTVTNGLILNGTCYVGNPTNGNYGAIGFAGSQTLGGNGTVVFGNYGQPSANEYVAGQCRNDVDDWQRDYGGRAAERDIRSGYSSWFGGTAERGRHQPGNDIGECQRAEQFTMVAQPLHQPGTGRESVLGTLPNLSGTLTTAGLGSMKSGNGPLALSGVLTNNGTDAGVEWCNQSS